MTKSILITLMSSLLYTYQLFGQMPVVVTEQTLKIGGVKEEVMHFGFTEGDQIVFNFTEVDGKELKEVEILEYPTSSKFSDYKTSRIENKILNVDRQAVYTFRFQNSALSGRICKIKIQRIPASEKTKSFITNVVWVTKQDTTWNRYTKNIIAGYDTTFQLKTNRELVKTEHVEDIILDKTERVHSINNLDYKNFKVVHVNLPQNQISTYRTKRIVSWAYWIGVGKEASEAWAQNVQVFKSVASGTASALGYGPLAGLAVGAITDLAMPKMGEDVAYWFIPDHANAQLFMANQNFMQFDKGKGIAAFGKNTNKTQGTFFVGLYNDNQMLGIDANIKISVIWEINYFEDKQYTERIVTPRYEKKIFKDPIITTSRILVTEK